MPLQAHPAFCQAGGAAALGAGSGGVFSIMGIALAIHTRQKDGADTPPTVPDDARDLDDAQQG